MSPIAMNVKASKVATVGFSPPLCGPDRAWCFEETDDQKTRAWMAVMCGSSPRFGSLQASYLGASVGCGHLNPWLHALEEKRPCAEPAWQDDAGN